MFTVFSSAKLHVFLWRRRRCCPCNKSMNICCHSYRAANGLIEVRRLLKDLLRVAERIARNIDCPALKPNVAGIFGVGIPSAKVHGITFVGKSSTSVVFKVF